MMPDSLNCTDLGIGMVQQICNIRTGNMLKKLLLETVAIASFFLSFPSKKKKKKDIAIIVEMQDHNSCKSNMFLV